MKTLYAIVLFFALPLCVFAQKKEEQAVYVSDIVHFWQAFDSLHTTHDTVKQQYFIQTLYIDKGTVGLKAFMKARNYDAALWVRLVNKFPKFWASIRKNTLEVKNEVQPIEASIKKFKVLYPDMKPSKMYFTVGGLRSGGTTTGNMVLVGTEIATGDRNTDASELGPWLQGVFKNQDNTEIVPLNVHEYVHTQQHNEGQILLAQTITEGAADFVAEVVTGIPNNSAYMRYGRDHEPELKAKFKTGMFGPDLHEWLYNGSNVAHADLGYFIGYEICKAYYDHTADKKRAIKTIIQLDLADTKKVAAFLNNSGYYDEPVNADELIAQYKLLQPCITGITPAIDKRKDVSAKITELTINFSEPMTKGISISYGKGGKDHYPVTSVAGFADDKRSVKLKVELKPDQSYDFVMTGNSFRSEAGYPLTEYTVSFKTGSN